MITYIETEVERQNLDNLSRTYAYQNFYEKNHEVTWAYLASVVSRNAGWNMTDLKGELLPAILSTTMQKKLFLVYEAANWLIFSDAYPQLLLYEESKKRNKPYFHLLSHFHVSSFMVKEWLYFWKRKNIDRLCTALIINEQHLIQKPILESPHFKKTVFDQYLFTLVDRFHFNTVIFPTRSGDLYGFSVHGFKHVKNRIELGKHLARLLLYSKRKKDFYEFIQSVPHTGSRYDYEQFVTQVNRKRTPSLSECFPAVTHSFQRQNDWYLDANETKLADYFQPIKKNKRAKDY
ncbi:MAG: DUF2515 domain-containing protein [Bacillaceae bacterium]|nr:DUF2515 domain-containing protein [Bacillaceae bacterium]